MREMVVDANVLLRFLTGEPEPLAKRAGDIFASAETRRVVLVLTPLTLAEVVYVLQSFYDWPRETIAERLLALIEADVFRLLEREVLIQALAWFRDLPAVHFADGYIAAVALAQGHGQVISFDRELRRLPGVRLVASASDLPDGEGEGRN